MTKKKAAKKEKPAKVDGLGPDDKKKLRTAIRQVWSWSYPRRLCVARATDTLTGFATCEQCQATVAKIYPDHIIPAGEFDSGFIDRMFVPSKELQALCKKCHQVKTNAERRKK